MKKVIVSLVLVFSLCFSFAGCGDNIQEKEGDSSKKGYAPEEYTLSYEDEFKGELDKSVWSDYEFAPRRGGYWSPDQVTTKDGNLVITTEHKNDVEKPGYYTGIAYWQSKRSTYGYYEVRAKIQNTRGVWSAIWLQPDTMGEADGSARDGAEIDLFESAVPNRWQSNMHYDGYNKRYKPFSVQEENLYDVYHTYALDWKKDSLRFYMDGKLYKEITDPNMIPQVATAMQLSTEISGKQNAEGIPTPNSTFWIGCGSITDNKPEELPSQFIVDYVRVYDNGDLIWS